MTLRMAFRGLMAAAALALAVYGAQPPWEKPVNEWSAEDIAALLNNSPWSIRTAASMDDPADIAEPQRVGPPDTGERGPGGTPKTRWDGEPGRKRKGQLATVPITVRWESALPIRQAQKDAAAPADVYVISVAGLIPAGRYRTTGQTETTSSSDGSVDARNPEELLEAFMSYSKIVVKGARDIEPENVKLDAATGVVRIFFSRKAAIDPEQKEVQFVTHFGDLHVRAKFRVFSMKYHGNTEL